MREIGVIDAIVCVYLCERESGLLVAIMRVRECMLGYLRECVCKGMSASK